MLQGEHSTILLTFIQLPFVIKIFVSSIFEWPFYTGFTVLSQFQDNRVHIGPKIEMRVVILGLDDAGKTSILFKMKQNEFITTIPTIGRFFISMFSIFFSGV